MLRIALATAGLLLLLAASAAQADVPLCTTCDLVDMAREAVQAGGQGAGSALGHAAVVPDAGAALAQGTFQDAEAATVSTLAQPASAPSFAGGYAQSEQARTLAFLGAVGIAL